MGWLCYRPVGENDAISHIKERNANAFVRHIPECMKLLHTIPSSQEISHFCLNLSVSSNILTILGFIIIDNHDYALKGLPSDTTILATTLKRDIAKAIISVYENVAQIFHKKGLHSFLTRLTPCDKETFYTHTLFHNMPNIMIITYKLHGLGISIFTMEGFGYKNFISNQVANN